MGPDAGQKAVDVLLNQGGVLGAVCVIQFLALIAAGWVIRGLYNDLKVCNSVSLDDRRELIKAVEAAKDGAERSENAFKSLQQTLEARGQTVSELSRQIEINGEKNTHAFGNLGQSLASFVRLLEREQERLDAILRLLERDRGDRGRP